MAFLDETGATILADEVKTYVGNTAVAKETGKGLSTNDYTTAEKNKLAGIVDGANKTIVDSTLNASSENPVQNKVVKGAVDEINNSLNSEISRAKEADETLKSRVDNIISLPEGSTTGDAELQDIRVKADGTIAENAGNAVREQISELKSDFGNLRFSITENNLLHVERKE